MGMVFNIQKFCLQDGPGIRTTVFLKGCPLKCEWCHNPESHNLKKDLLFDREKCVGCKRCQEICEQGVHALTDKHLLQKSKCISCGECVKNCYSDALEISGKEMTADEVLTEVLKDEPFYKTSGGGLTLSGGEPLLQFEFSLEILKAAKEKGIHTCVETCGYAETEKILKLAEYTDRFLYDWKISDSELHKKYTGVGNELILKNLYVLNDAGTEMILRCPIIPGVNDTAEHFERIGALAENLENVVRVEVEPYHSLGVDKLKRLERSGDTTTFLIPTQTDVNEWIDTISKHTKKNVKIA